MNMNNNENNKKTEQLKRHSTSNENEKLTTNQGLKINNNQDSLKAGERGPSLLEDFILREKLLILIMKEFLKE
jgi:catalase